MKQIKIIRSILKNTYLEAFNNYLSSVENEKDKNSPTEEQVEEALAKVTLKAFANDRHAYRHQVGYTRYQLYFTMTNFENFFHRLKQMNTYLKYFPIQLQIASLMSSSGLSSGKRKKKDNTSESEGTALHKCKWCKKMVTHEDDDCWEKTGNEDVVKPHWAKRRRVGPPGRALLPVPALTRKRKVQPLLVNNSVF